jgi:hypothetical protein
MIFSTSLACASVAYRTSRRRCRPQTASQCRGFKTAKAPTRPKPFSCSVSLLSHPTDYLPAIMTLSPSGILLALPFTVDGAGPRNNTASSKYHIMAPHPFAKGTCRTDMFNSSCPCQPWTFPFPFQNPVGVSSHDAEGRPYSYAANSTASARARCSG